MFALGAFLRLPSFGGPLLSTDEASFAATAAALSRCDRMYRDLLDHPQPAIHHLYQAGAALLGEGHAHGAHLLALLAVLITAALLWRMVSADTREAAGSASRGAAAAGLYLVFSTTWHARDSRAANGELFLLLPQSAAALLLLRAVDMPRTRHPLPWHLVIGLLIGLAALFRYQTLTFLGVSAGLLDWAVMTGRMPWRRALLAMVLHVLGAMLPSAMYLASVAANDAGAAAVSWFTSQFASPDGGPEGTPGPGRVLLRLLAIGAVALVPYTLGMRAAARTLRAWGLSRRAEGESALELRSLLGTIWLITSVVAVAAGGRYEGHHFLLLLPPLCLLAAPAFVEIWRRGGGARLALGILCAAPALVFFVLATLQLG